MITTLELLNLKTATYNDPYNISDKIFEDVAKGGNIYGVLGWVKLKPEFIANDNDYKVWCYNFVNKLASYLSQNEYTDDDIGIFTGYLAAQYISMDEENLELLPYLKTILELTPSKQYEEAWLSQEEVRLIYLNLLSLDFDSYTDEIFTQLAIANTNIDKVREVRETFDKIIFL